MERSETNQTAGTNDVQRLEKKQQQLVDVENEYFRLNPWYNQQREKPVFGLGQPLPHTLRRGMWWGKSDVKKRMEELEVQEADLQKGIDARDMAKGRESENESDGSQTPLKPGQPSQSTNGDLQSYTQGRMPNIRRPTSNTHSMAGKQRNDESTTERAPINNHGLDEADQGNNGRNNFGLQDGLHPLQELDTSETTQTQKDDKEIQKREHEEQQDYYNQYRNPIARLRAQYPQAPAEFLATFIYLFLGICANLSIATSSESTGSFESQAWAWGFAVMVGIYLSGGVSGGHLSPCITISLSIFRGFPWRMAIVYICMQLLAGLAAGGLAYGLYYDAINAIDPEHTLELTGKALFPKGPAFTPTTAFFNDFIFMALYTCIAFALGDDQNSPPGQGMTALIFGFVGYLMMVSLGYNTGLGISPARDLGPRLVGLWAGYDAFSDAYWAYGPFGAATSGAIFGGFIYDLFVFVGGESPVNYRWPEKGDIKWKLNEKKEQARDKIQRLA
ncbi:aquaporin-like protein [Boeremia exigua]|uniref:aquaporin-like protein n=1 Tax=Boeremia exigua TaxID=749465 RepID=UPI001E8D9DA3|nr:aquaporin-like protein [Boeremia exigua]KAH6614890.1 aquaporin-like protein [Boeremia exigua]